MTTISEGPKPLYLIERDQKPPHPHRFPCSFSASIVAATLTVLWTLPGPLASQEVRFLSLDGEGSATLVLDASTAYVTDGGGPGAGGIKGALVEGQPVLDFLAGKATRLVLTCTHPHEDHMGGLAQLLCLPQVCEFPEVILIDTPDSYGEGESLADLWQETCGAPCADQPEGRCRHVTARNNDAFAGLAPSSSAVRVANFIFDPAEVGGDAHDRTIITHYEIGQRQETTTLVDFDDASSRLIRHWTDRNQGRHVDVVVMSHHGSRYNDMTPVLGSADPENGAVAAGAFGVKQVVFTANRHNRFAHPAPEVLRQTVQLLGPENVFITDSVTGRSIRVTPAGIAYGDGTSPSRALALFVEARLAQLAEQREAIETALLGVDGLDGGLRATITAGGALSTTQLATAVAAGWLGKSERRALRRAYLGSLHLDAVQDRLGPTSTDESLVAIAREGGHRVAREGAAQPGDNRLIAASTFSLGATTWSDQPPEVWRVALQAVISRRSPSCPRAVRQISVVH